MRASAPIACTALLLGACWSAPELGRPRTAVQSLQRPLEPDLSTTWFASRMQGIGATLHHLAQEPVRATHLATAPARLFRSEFTRADSVPGDATELVRREANRTHHLHRGVDAIVHEVVDVEGNRDRHLEATAKLLVLDDAPLGEIDDRRHRTDPDDDRPEASLWQRIARRLRL